MENVTAIIIGVVSSLISSSLFLFFIRGIRPKLIISPFISKEFENGKPVYRIKVLNLSRRVCINVRAELKLQIPKTVPDGILTTNVPIELPINYLFQIEGYKKNDNEALYAKRFRVYQDLDALWIADNSYLTFKIVATDSFSGFTSVFIKKFYTKRNTIINGSHGFGKSLKVS